LTSAAPSAATRTEFNNADVSFLEMMYPHHAQAVEMTSLVPGRGATAKLRKARPERRHRADVGHARNHVARSDERVERVVRQGFRQDAARPGHGCAHCVATITAAVGPIPGVTGVGVDVANGVVTVSGSPDPQAVAAAIKDSGYDVDSAA
jgi:copper chaperone